MQSLAQSPSVHCTSTPHQTSNTQVQTCRSGKQRFTAIIRARSDPVQEMRNKHFQEAILCKICATSTSKAADKVIFPAHLHAHPLPAASAGIGQRPASGHKIIMSKASVRHACGIRPWGVYQSWVAASVRHWRGVCWSWVAAPVCQVPTSASPAAVCRR